MNDESGDLPPVYEPVRVTIADSAFVRAIRHAERGGEEGTLLRVDAPRALRTQHGTEWAFRPGDLDAALVLRPDYPAARALELPLVAIASLGAAVAELVAPMIGLGYRWPDRVQLGAADAAAIRMAMGPGDPPQWLVLGVMVNVVDVELGPDRATLNGNGGAVCDADTVLARFCRFFLDSINNWAENGLEPARRGWTRRGLGRDEPLTLRVGDEEISGYTMDLDSRGALQLKTPQGMRRVELEEFFS